MTQSSFDVVIIGAGHGGVELAAALRQHPFSGTIALISDEPDVPYQRPPLSKDYIKRAANTPALVLKPENFYADNAIDLRLGAKAEAVDRESRSVALSDGSSILYGHLVFATGARNRKPPVPGLEHLLSLGVSYRGRMKNFFGAGESNQILGLGLEDGSFAERP